MNYHATVDEIAAMSRAYLTIDPDRYYQPKDNEEVSRKFQVQGVTHYPGTNT
jgi:hypothetical protein